jgi:hypothetical protein
MTASIEAQHRGRHWDEDEALDRCALICRHRLGTASLITKGPISRAQPPRGMARDDVQTFRWSPLLTALMMTQGMSHCPWMPWPRTDLDQGVMVWSGSGSSSSSWRDDGKK